MGNSPDIGNWLQETRALSLAAKGAWIDIQWAMWQSRTKGRLSMPLVGYSRILGATVDQTKAVITELVDLGVCDCEIDGQTVVPISQDPACNANVTLSVTGYVTLIHREMVKREFKRETTRLRVNKHRAAKVGNASCNAPGNADVTPPETPDDPPDCSENDFKEFWSLASTSSSKKLTFERWKKACGELKKKHENPRQVLLSAFQAYRKDCALDSSFGKEGRRPQNAETWLGPQKATWKQWIGQSPEDIRPNRKLPFKDNPYEEF